ncbi:MAG: hypothetical protein AB8B55_17290 [Mariniblastus sp.]
MNRYKGLMRDTWWAWITIVLFGVVGGFVSWIFFSAIPIAFFAFFYFGFIRYDENGNHKEP